MGKTRRIFLAKEDYEELERCAAGRDISVQDLVGAAAEKVRKEAKI